MDKILDYLYELYVDYIYLPYRGLKNLWIWKGIIWHDRQFDFSFMLRILIKKLKLMEDGFRFHGVCVDAQKIFREIRKVRLLIERIESENYTHKIFNKEDYRHSEYLIKQDIELFTKIINKKLRTWWD